MCVICSKPITEEFDIDHMIPREMATDDRKAELDALCARLNRPDFDVWGFQNLGPAHRQCNNKKATELYPDTILHERLTFIEKNVEEVERRIIKSVNSRQVERAMLTILGAITTGAASETAINTRIKSATGTPVPPIPQLAVAWTPTGSDSLRKQGLSVRTIESAITSAIRRGDVRVLRDPRPSGSVILRFFLDSQSWRAYATLDDGLLLVTEIHATQ